MKKFKTNLRFNTDKNLNEVNCEGYFNNSFFSLVDLLDRQDEVWKGYKYAIENKNEYAILYEVLEHMRVALVLNK